MEQGEDLPEERRDASRCRLHRPAGDDTVIDSRGKTVIIHYGLCRIARAGYQPRLADDRIGYFLSVVKDFSSDNKDTSFIRYINRWRLERADGSPWKQGAKLVPPKKKIVFWIEKSRPRRISRAVREGILEWNKAFEKIGFRDAIEVRQQENEEFDPEDVNYSTFRWITTDRGFAMGPSRANPLTGEIIDADIIFDASMVRFYRRDQQLYKNDSAASPPFRTAPSRPARRGLERSPVRSAARPGAGTTRHRRSDPYAAMRASSRRTVRDYASVRRKNNRNSASRLTALAPRLDLKPRRQNAG